jgi:hypothetical protein
MPLPQPALKAEESTEMSFPHNRFLWITGVCMTVLVLATHILTINRQAPWEDEIFAVSTGWSIVHSQPASLSVLTPYPRTISPVRFYGPVSFEAEAWLTRIFGLSMASWRLICFAGVILALLVSIGLVRLAGGDRWAQLITALTIALAGSIAAQQPGRWDFVTVGLFLSGLLFFLRGIKAGGRALLWRVVAAGGSIGFALGSTPRALPLCCAALTSVLLAAPFFGEARKRLMLGILGIVVIAPLVQTLLLLPWGLTSLSWYAFVKKATGQNAISATPLTGRGVWDLDLRLHKTLLVAFSILLISVICSAVMQAEAISSNKKIAYKLFLTLFGFVNLAVMLLLFVHPLGQSAFWLPAALTALMGWWDWKFLRMRKLGSLAAAFVGVALLILAVQWAQPILAIALTWNRRSTADLTAFVSRTLPKHAVVFGPVGGYFYPVELSQDHYFYPFENTTPGLYSEPPTSATEAIEAIACAGPTYVIWPQPDPPRQPFWGPMPAPLRARAQGRIGEFHEPALSSWKENLLRRIGAVGGKYGFPDLSVYPLKALGPCGRKRN